MTTDGKHPGCTLWQSEKFTVQVPPTCLKSILFLQLRKTHIHYLIIPYCGKILYFTYKDQNPQFKLDSDWIWNCWKCDECRTEFPIIVDIYCLTLINCSVPLFMMLHVYKRFNWELFITRNTVNQKTGVNVCSHLLSW